MEKSTLLKLVETEIKLNRRELADTAKLYHTQMGFLDALEAVRCWIEEPESELHIPALRQDPPPPVMENVVQCRQPAQDPESLPTETTLRQGTEHEVTIYASHVPGVFLRTEGGRIVESLTQDEYERAINNIRAGKPAFPAEPGGDGSTINPAVAADQAKPEDAG